MAYQEHDELEALLDERDARRWAAVCHLAGLAMYTGIPFGGVLGPFIVWLLKKEESPFIDDQGKEAINFQISMAIYTFIGIALIFVVIGFVLLPIVLVAHLVLLVVAAVAANDGKRYRYPLTIRLVK